MKAAELYDYLIKMGCNPDNFRVMDRGGYSDVMCLSRRDDGKWEVYYSERGIESSPEYSTEDEEDAVAWFRNLVLSMEHRHCVGIYSKRPNANKLRNRLESAGLEVAVDSIPYGGLEDLRYRVFVPGKGISFARKLLGDDLPKTD